MSHLCSQTPGSKAKALRIDEKVKHPGSRGKEQGERNIEGRRGNVRILIKLTAKSDCLLEREHPLRNLMKNELKERKEKN